MKISKLFHWLYALVMFIPILFFIPNVFYYGFNEHATLSPSEPIVTADTTVQYLYEYQTNVVNSWSDLQYNKVYYSESLAFGNDGSAEYDEIDFDIRVIKSGSVTIGSEIADYYLNEIYFDSFDLSYWDFYMYFSSGLCDEINTVLPSSDGYVAVNYVLDGSTSYFFGLTIEDCYFVIIDGLDNFVLYCTGIDNPLSLPQQSDYLGNIVSATATADVTIDYDDTTITSAVYNGWSQMWDLPVFSWTHNTFFSAPFNYISGLFGFETGNSLSYLLSYWFSISIIWLVFDVMIYVPLLVHRWLDKASLE